MEYWLTRVSWKLLLNVDPHLSLPEKPTYTWKEQSVLLALQTDDNTAAIVSCQPFSAGDKSRGLQVEALAVLSVEEALVTI